MSTRCLLTLAVAMASSAGAQPATSALDLVLHQYLVQTVARNAERQERLLAAPKTVSPGAVLEQRLNATNSTRAPLTSVRLQLPVPSGTSFLAQNGAPTDSTTEFSFDDGRTYGLAPLKRKVTRLENGQSVTRDVTVPPSAYTNVRWTVPTLAGGELLKLSLRVQVK